MKNKKDFIQPYFHKKLQTGIFFKGRFKSGHVFKFKKNKAGFTLIELLVVISIIGLLGAIVITSLYSARIKAKDAKRKEDASQIRQALEWYFHSNNEYPNGGTVGGPNANSNDGVDIQALSYFLASSTPPVYISKIPNDPASGPLNYMYVWKNSGLDYGLLVPFGNDGGISCMWRTPHGSNQWFKSGPITMPDCSYQN